MSVLLLDMNTMPACHAMQIKGLKLGISLPSALVCINPDGTPALFSFDQARGDFIIPNWKVLEHAKTYPGLGS